MKQIDRIQVISDLYHNGKLEAMQLMDLQNPTIKYDIIVFMYIKYPEDIERHEYVPLDYVYGATNYLNDKQAEYKAVLDHYDRIYKALKKNKLLKGGKK